MRNEYSLKLCQPSPLFQSPFREARSSEGDVPAVHRKNCDREGNLFYSFSINGDEIFCREAYESAEGILAHLDNVGALLKEMLTMADLTRVEVHGPAKEIDKLRGPLAHLNPAWFTLV